MRRTQKIAVGMVAVLAIAGAGGAVAATKLGTPEEERKAVVNDVAGQLGVTPERLTAAVKTALKNQVDRAVAAGHLTEAQGNELKERIDQNDLPLLLGPAPGFRGPGFGFRHHGPGPFHHGLETAAKYLGMTEAALRAQLEDGKTLAQVARSKGKSVSGLVNAIVAEKQARIQEDVKDGRLTQAQADDFVAGLKERVTDLINGRFPRLHEHRFRPGGPRGPPETRPSFS
jgi:hypothetical protein